MADNNYQYLMNGTRLTNYSVIPNTVCEMNISSTAKVIYAKLLNRAQLSASNDFVDSFGRAWNGNRMQIKRKKFEEFIDKQSVI